MRNDWQGLLKIIEINIKDKNNNIIWEDKNLYNILHTEGTEFILSSTFLGGPTSNAFIPLNYYFGLDARATLTAADTMASILNEPLPATGYARQSVSSLNQFTIITSAGIKQAISPILTFGATTSWGPVKNLFLTTKTTNDGYLISSVALSTAATISVGQTLNLRMGLSLKDCP